MCLGTLSASLLYTIYIIYNLLLSVIKENKTKIIIFTGWAHGRNCGCSVEELTMTLKIHLVTIQEWLTITILRHVQSSKIDVRKVGLMVLSISASL